MCEGCVFAPYFCHEQGATHFAAIHKVFGASNVSKLLAHLPVSDRCEAAVTISYEAQARLQDPIYGCVSHIFALQQQVMTLQAQLASIKEQAAQSLLNGLPQQTLMKSTMENQLIFIKIFKAAGFSQRIQTWCHNSIKASLLQRQHMEKMGSWIHSMGNYGNSSTSTSFDSFEEASHSVSSLEMQTADNRQWTYQDSDDLRSVAFGYMQRL
ncbi:hypothetical protein GH714_027577 [Hevea brasiliensis]|uniref:LOB domain-containing protein n=1 Tax=Hevea brasiliensis TaxID=3981 RepID=A0A6A6N7D0_HEVBR|nr:hypothetical protein GH714_027577 [Hevea brasiliensis]